MYQKSIYATLFPHLAPRPVVPPAAGSSDLDRGDGTDQPQLTLGGLQTGDQPQAARTPEQPQQSPVTIDPALLQLPSDVDLSGTAMSGAPLGSTWMRPEANMAIRNNKDATRKDYLPDELRMPIFEGTQSEQQLQEAQWKSQNAQNKDKGFKARLGEILQNFLAGLGQADPRAGIGGMLGAGAATAGVGLFNRSMNERIGAMQQIPQLRKQVEFENAQNVRKAQAGTEYAQQANYANQMRNRDMGTQIEMDKASRDRLTQERKYFLDIWGDPNVEFDPENNEKDKAFAKSAAEYGVQLLPKKRGQKFSATVAPDGRVLITNTSTGEYRIGNENLAKPTSFTDKDISDAEFGLYSDKELESMASARVGEGIPATAYKPDLVAALPASVKNEDGTFNLEKFSKLKGEGDESLGGVDLRDLMTSLPDNYKQRHAKEIEKLRKSQGGLKKQVDRFRSILNHRTPNPNAEAITLDEAKQWFKTALTKSPKELEQFFQILQQANIR